MGVWALGEGGVWALAEGQWVWGRLFEIFLGKMGLFAVGSQMRYHRSESLLVGVFFFT